MAVDPGNESQTVTVAGASSGTFTLTYSGQTTAAIAFDAVAATVQTRLVALSNVGTGNVAVTGNAGGPYTVTFQGALKNTNVAQMTASATGLDAGTVTVATTAQGDRPVAEICYVDISSGGTVANLEVLIGQVPPAGSALISKHDYYA